ncbi:probable chlorophyll(ide) b reductase NYC1, chloroplastic isoform X2 [Sorghum bicolor]|uniref:probable chlorophyll(ide) b reductase NYC1, chloroplastic isoform X2 n=1 Tax=Sorghum bicolor TaxID=4558 RepID=UPI000B4236C2|nr:probable chlorophyll(ide) b reductase NYC1, chloroplastic isoform X2 [Sorghum bicolor]|eukprot:XP_021312943.1 probable chlorophyll(ide) b reductase NYC1, chloroplastic isoform X2 [Sorghum bicolor]
MAAAAAAAVAHLSVHGRLRRSPEHRPSTSSSSAPAHRPSLLRCRAFKQETDGGGGDRDSDPSEPDARKRRKGPLYKLKAAIQGLAGSRSAAAEVYGGEHQYQRAVEKAEEIFFSVATQLGRYAITMMSSGVVLGVGFQLSGLPYTCGDSQMNELIWYSWLGGVIIGTMIGANSVLEEHCKAGPRNVVITGSTRGLGKALAREFLLSGDHVVITSRSPESVLQTITELEENIQEGLSVAKKKERKILSHAKVVGTACDVCKPEDVKKLVNFAINELGSVDIWINNAGTNKGFRPLVTFSDDDITQIVSTNLVGSLLCTREAMNVMQYQEKGGHIFNMDGAGSGGSSTPLTAVYGSTKCGLRQFQGSLLKESRRSKVGVHTASPGMVLTDLLLSGSSIRNKQMFNLICELPETVARTLVPRMRVVKGSGKAINYLTPPRILLALVTAWVRRGRWFDDEGRAVYAAEADRIRNWAESRARFSFTDAMEMYTENTWVSVFSLSVVCAFIILSSSGGPLPGT